MTHPLQYFKMCSAIVALCLPLGCINDTVSVQKEKIEQRLAILQSQSQTLEIQAFNIESQIDEIRRANAETRDDKIKTLRLQFYELKATHKSLQQEMSGLRQDLTLLPEAD